MARRVCALVLVVCGWTVQAAGQEAVPIGTILADKKAYHGREVILRGQVHGIEQLPPYRTTRSLCWGSYTFTLQDDTGSIPVFVQGACSVNTMNPDVKPRQVTEGEEVSFEASIFVGDYGGGYYNPDGKAMAINKEFLK
jgi:hypothetical protein